MPKPSTATGFSMNTCRPFCTAYSKWSGRKCGGVARITRSTSLSMTFWYASKPTKRWSASTAIRSAISASPERLLQRAFEAVGERVAHRDELDGTRRAERLARGARAAAAAADQADADLAVAERFRDLDALERCGAGRRGRRHRRWLPRRRETDGERDAGREARSIVERGESRESRDSTLQRGQRDVVRSRLSERRFDPHVVDPDGRRCRRARA